MATISVSSKLDQWRSMGPFFFQRSHDRDRKWFSSPKLIPKILIAKVHYNKFFSNQFHTRLPHITASYHWLGAPWADYVPVAFEFERTGSRDNASFVF